MKTFLFYSPQWQTFLLPIAFILNLRLFHPSTLLIGFIILNTTIRFHLNFLCADMNSTRFSSVPTFLNPSSLDSFWEICSTTFQKIFTSLLKNSAQNKYNTPIADVPVFYKIHHDFLVFVLCTSTYTAQYPGLFFYNHFSVCSASFSDCACIPRDLSVVPF